MRTPVLILPVKGLISRTLVEGGKKWQNFADLLYGWPLIDLETLIVDVDSRITHYYFV